jgi:hypothetical protein
LPSYFKVSKPLQSFLGKTFTVQVKYQYPLKYLYGSSRISGITSQNRVISKKDRVLWKIFGPKRDEMTGEWRRLYNEELYAVYSSPNVIRRM